jgi:small subunit ribosomal protein S1
VTKDTVEPLGENARPARASEEEVHPMDAFLEGEAYEMEAPRRGEVRTGTIARVVGADILVDIGAKSEGVIPAREIEQLSAEDRETLRVGEEISVYITRSSERDGSMILSYLRAVEERDWREAETLLETQGLFEGKVAGFNKGGLIVKLGRLRGFLPASQVSLARRRRAEGETPDKRWGKMVGEPIMAKVIEVDRRRNRLILSERAAAREAREALKERLISELQPGEIRDGHVISLADFGAFVDIGGADGLVHSSEISWKRVGHPREVLAVGQSVRVKVLQVDPEKRRISLSMRELEPDPWELATANLREGQLVEAKITKLTKFGAFARLEGVTEYEIEGLIHISELADRRVEHPREVLEVGQKVTLRVIKIDGARRRIGLSLKRVDSSEYVDSDWQAAMHEAPSPAGAAEELDGEVEDFDAELEAEAGEGGMQEDEPSEMEAEQEISVRDAGGGEEQASG